jgi:hypothetical protein
MSHTDLTMKVGDTLIADCIYKDAAGVPVNLDAAGISIKSAVAFPDGIKRQELQVIPADQVLNPGKYQILGDTSQWPSGVTMRWDVRYFKGATSFSSKTVTIHMLPRIT